MLKSTFDRLPKCANVQTSSYYSAKIICDILPGAGVGGRVGTEKKAKSIIE